MTQRSNPVIDLTQDEPNDSDASSPVIGNSKIQQRKPFRFVPKKAKETKETASIGAFDASIKKEILEECAVRKTQLPKSVPKRVPDFDNWSSDDSSSVLEIVAEGILEEALNSYQMQGDSEQEGEGASDDDGEDYEEEGGEDYEEEDGGVNKDEEESEDNEDEASVNSEEQDSVDNEEQESEDNREEESVDNGDDAGTPDSTRDYEISDLLVVVAQDGDLTICVGDAPANIVRFQVDSAVLRRHKKWADLLDEREVLLPPVPTLQQGAESMPSSPKAIVAKDQDEHLDASPGAVDHLLQTIIAAQDANLKDPSEENQSTELHIPGVIGEALAIMLNVLHANYAKLPSVVDTDTMWYLANLCEQFAVAELVKPFVIPSVERLIPKSNTCGNLDLLYIAWVFKFQEWFESQFHNLVCETRKDFPHNEDERDYFLAECGPKLISKQKPDMIAFSF